MKNRFIVLLFLAIGVVFSMSCTQGESASSNNIEVSPEESVAEEVVEYYEVLPNSYFEAIYTEKVIRAIHGSKDNLERMKYASKKKLLFLFDIIKVYPNEVLTIYDVADEKDVKYVKIQIVYIDEKGADGVPSVGDIYYYRVYVPTDGKEDETINPAQKDSLIDLSDFKKIDKPEQE